ncbi:hypothetical protein AAJ76_4300026850 [Vairimorpha ceranae]|uniref:Uncharacterized protein n=2 Tax=Vairimorpha ceranae TaxID=40302 RepID=A0A0F9ZAK7_9MICR|nr:hypothetical protein AAJ76_4300026850 [Vairimorpha ceranae]KAF5141773.1 hypothetical protein G9O61_00g000560 [Vairimorpha ceranae]KKO74834.1 hypothetical protein AAJ76_4300026850 [Vairimorpha ceranae]
MSKIENETKKTSPQESEKSVIDPKNKKKGDKKENVVVGSQSKQEKKKTKQEKSKNVMAEEKQKKDSLGVKSSQKSNVDENKLKDAEQNENKKVNEPVSKKVANNKKVITSEKKEDLPKMPSNIDKEKKMKSSEHEKNLSSLNKKSKKSPSAMSHPESLESKTEAKESQNASYSKEESSNLIINYFKQISEDLRAIRNHFVPETSIQQPLLEEKKVIKPNKKNTMDKGDMPPSKKSKSSDEEEIPVKRDAEKNKSDVKESEAQKNVSHEKELDDDYYMSKLNKKFGKNIEFTIKEARQIWITGVGRLSSEKWQPILNSLCDKKMLVLVDQSGEKDKYKIVD